MFEKWKARRLRRDCSVAITHREPLRFDYVRRDGEVRPRRTAYPIALFVNREGELSVGAWCTLRNDWRTFALCRMSAVETRPTPCPAVEQQAAHRLDPYVWAKTVARYGREGRRGALRSSPPAADWRVAEAMGRR